jgi:hypothetical protein
MRILTSLLIIISFVSKKSTTDIYTEGEHIFSVQVFENDEERGLKFNQPHYQTETPGEYKNAWELGHEKNIEFIGLEIMGGTINGDQKTIRWNFYNASFDKIDEEITGLIENDSRIWLHPPRTKYFEILEINPFPEIRLDATKWSTLLKVGDHWSNKKWKVWEGNITISSEYKYDKENSDVVSIASSEIGNTQLTSRFDIEKGFTRFEYVNIDGSRIVMRLIEFRK